MTKNLVITLSNFMAQPLLYHISVCSLTNLQRILIWYLPIFAANLFCSLNLNAQSLDFKFEHITEKQNLSHNTVEGIIQDKEGFIWFSTIDGLNQFDGYACKVYRHNDGDSTSISVNFLHGIYEDSKGYLWISTRGGGINRLDKRTGIFKQYKHIPGDPNSLSNNNVNCILEDKSGNFWIGTETGLDLLNPQSGMCKHFKHEPNNPISLSSNWINEIIQDKDGCLWISSFNGLNKYDPVSKKFMRYFNERNNRNSLSENFTTSLFEDEDGIIWIGTKGGGLNSFDKEKNLFSRYNEAMLKSLSSLPLNINSIILFEKDQLLIGTEGEGLLLFDKKKNIFYAFKHEPRNSFSISSDIVTGICKDNQNNIWIGTWGGGVNKLAGQKKEFNLISSAMLDKASPHSASVFALWKDKQNNVWIGTKAKGLTKLNRSSNTFYKHYLNSSKGINAIYEDKQGFLWLASEGLIRFNKRDGSYKIFNSDPDDENSVSSNDIKCINADSKGNLWIGTEDGGACSFNPKTNKWKRYFNNKNNPTLVRCIYEDKAGNIWLGTYRSGLIKLEMKTGKAVTYSQNPADIYSLSNNDVRCIMESSDNEMWIATYGGGINKYDSSSGRFYSIKENDGLSNNFTYGILEDEEGNFWISTNYGLTKYNRKNNSFKIYTQEDGLQNNEFNTGAFLKADDGEMFFGGISGFNNFYPGKIKDNIHIPPVYLTSFKIFDKEIKLDSLITYKKNISLSYDDKFFSFDFTALDFINHVQNRYAYKLEGFDRDWIRTGQRRFASYTNLDPGQYNFRVIACNSDGIWNTTGASLRIVILPPFWMTWWFETILGVVLLSALIGTVRYYSTRKLKEHIRALEKEQAVRKERERISRDLHDNVGSQLTYLISSIDNLTFARENHSLKTVVDRLKDVSAYGRKTIKELRDTIWAMKHEDAEISQLILKLNELRQEINSSLSSLHMEINNSVTKPVTLNAQQTLSLYRITQEALQNIIKHSRASKVEISFSEIQSKILLQIKDNGKGFDIDNTIKGNGLTNMKNRCEDAGGKFQISSSGNGTVISCLFEK